MNYETSEIQWPSMNYVLCEIQRLGMNYVASEIQGKHMNKKKGIKMKKDKRPDPKPRKNPQLWQAFLWVEEVEEARKRHLLRLSSISRGKSNLDATVEENIMEHMNYDALLKLAKKELVTWGKQIKVWDWLTSFKGLGAGKIAAQVLAQFDDVAKFATVSKFWRFSGWACMDGHIDRCEKGKTSPYNRKLKSIVYLCVDQFVKQRTSVYREIYDDEKARQKRLHPDKLCLKCYKKGIEIKKEDCKEKGHTTCAFSDGHIDSRARRKVAKIFLQHLWLVWRHVEGLPVSKPWIEEIGGHTNIVKPPNFDYESLTFE